MDALAALRRAVDECCEAVEALPEQALGESLWGPRGVLAHLIFWMESYASQLEAIRRGEPPAPPAGTFDALNHRAVDESRGISVSALVARYRSACARLLDLAAGCDLDGVFFTLKAGSPPQPLRWFLEGEAGHIRGHLPEIWCTPEAVLAEAVAALRAAGQALGDVVRAQIETEKLTEAGLITLAQQAVWLEHYGSQVEAALAGEAADSLRGQRKRLLAEAAWQAQAETPEALLVWFDSALDRLCALASPVDPQTLLLEVHWPGFSHLYTLDSGLERIANQIRNRVRALADQG